MRSLLLIGSAALALSLSGLSASAATVSEAARNSNAAWVAFVQRAPSIDRFEPIYISETDPAMAAGPRETTKESVAEAAETIAALAGAGLLVTLAAVGLRRVWTQDPIPDRLGDGPGYL